jgi:hypothetical protein
MITDITHQYSFEVLLTPESDPFNKVSENLFLFKDGTFQYSSYECSGYDYSSLNR